MQFDLERILEQSLASKQRTLFELEHQIKSSDHSWKMTRGNTPKAIETREKLQCYIQRYRDLILEVQKLIEEDPEYNGWTGWTKAGDRYVIGS